ncbi:ISAs1 family transposase [Actinacidiphila oryziradicis]|uniref:ISAs1 family transposase n=1 Tax=Actinacidiphila oryziradicis TaxID=2571141 RepID=UPI0023F11456|nr:ISAs1 family transposase [Actinacidiphila oryziradicis]MCW2869779.1 hypothetical protein [Actinacidiphila oryziradicis]
MPVSSLIPPAVGQLADLALWETELATDPGVAESALVSRLRQVPDRRAKRGRRHALVVVLVLTACATLVVGGDSMAAVWQWAARAPQAKLARIGARRDPLTGRYLVPSERTFRRVLADLDADALDTATCGHVADLARGTVPASVIPPTPGPAEREQRRAAQRADQHPVPGGLLPAAALDGKALTGARTGTGTGTGRVFLVGAVAHESGAVIDQSQVPDKRGKGEAARALLTRLGLPGWVFTLDALHTTKKTARLITEELQAHYVLVLKGNQPLARAAAQVLLAGKDAGWLETTDAEDDRGHGRTERRTIRTAPADDSLFPGARQVFRLRRDTGDLDGTPGQGRRSSSASPACPPHKSAPPTSTTTKGHTGQWRTGSTGFVTSPSTKTTPSSGPVPRPAHRPASATAPSARSAWPDAPTSPTPAATCSTTRTPSPPTVSD